MLKVGEFLHTRIHDENLRDPIQDGLYSKKPEELIQVVVMTEVVRTRPSAFPNKAEKVVHNL